jgi:hypothetical protein
MRSRWRRALRFRRRAFALGLGRNSGSGASLPVADLGDVFLRPAGVTGDPRTARGPRPAKGTSRSVKRIPVVAG